MKNSDVGAVIQLSAVTWNDSRRQLFLNTAWDRSLVFSQAVNKEAIQAFLTYGVQEEGLKGRLTQIHTEPTFLF